MPNLAVAYAGPDVALATLAAKLRRVYGDPDRTYEFVTGYDRTGITSHNADATGRAHAMDIFVGPGNLSEAQGIDLAERLRAEGKRGKIPGHPDRLAYIIHRGRIAGDHTGWEWIPYTGKDWHGDHIHVSSVFDYYWGDPVPGNPADYNSNADWDLWEAEFQSGTITPIQEDDMAVLSAITKEAMLNLRGMVVDAVEAATKPILERVTATQKSVAFQEKFSVKMLEKIAATVGTSITPEDLEAIRKSVRDELAAGVKVDVTVAGAQ